MMLKFSQSSKRDRINRESLPEKIDGNSRFRKLLCDWPRAMQHHDTLFEVVARQVLRQQPQLPRRAAVAEIGDEVQESHGDERRWGRGQLSVKRRGCGGFTRIFRSLGNRLSQVGRLAKTQQ